MIPLSSRCIGVDVGNDAAADSARRAIRPDSLSMVLVRKERFTGSNSSPLGPGPL